MDNKESINDIKMRFHIVDALNKALEHTPYDEVAIKQICSAANISRPTFYRYFVNKESIPQWYIEHYFDIGSFQVGRTLSWHDGQFITLTGMKRASEFFRRLEEPNGCISLRQFGAKIHADKLRETVTEYRHFELTDRLDFQIDTFARTQANITVRWIAAGMVIPVETFVGYSNSVVPPELFAMLELPDSNIAELLKLAGSDYLSGDSSDSSAEDELEEEKTAPE